MLLIYDFVLTHEMINRLMCAYFLPLIYLFLVLFQKIWWVYLLKALTRRDSSTWATLGFKGLVARAKCNRHSYESELGFFFLSFLLEDEQKLSVGVFVRA